LWEKKAGNRSGDVLERQDAEGLLNLISNLVNFCRFAAANVFAKQTSQRKLFGLWLQLEYCFLGLTQCVSRAEQKGWTQAATVDHQIFRLASSEHDGRVCIAICTCPGITPRKKNETIAVAGMAKKPSLVTVAMGKKRRLMTRNRVEVPCNCNSNCNYNYN
jgi:hypothetical protein